MNKPKSVAQATPDEVRDLGKRSSPGTFAWDFPDFVFDGDWYKIGVRNETEMKSASASFRAQVKARLGMRSQVYLYKNDNIFYARATTVPAGAQRGRLPLDGS